MSFSLQARRMNSGLPNMPNYNLGKLEGVNCDSILAAGIADVNTQEQFLIYPNPAKDKVQFKWEHGEAKNITIELISIEGKIIKNVVANKTDSETMIDVSVDTPGIYILKFILDHRLMGFHKLVIVP
jgi:Secretion system C-terminal sorting domain